MNPALYTAMFVVGRMYVTERGGDTMFKNLYSLGHVKNVTIGG